jgi:hypothetical protein
MADVRSHQEHFTANRIGNLRGWADLYAKMERLVPTGRLQTLCRRRKREYLLSIAAQQARMRDWPGMRKTVVAAARARAFSPRGWLRLAKAVASPSRPRASTPGPFRNTPA